MNLSKQLAKHFRDVHFGNNWTGVNLKTVLTDVTWQEANTKIQDLNTILSLSFHINYYVSGVLEVFNNRPLEIRDEFSYTHSEINSEQEWISFRDGIFKDAETLATHIETLTNDKLQEDFADEKYGNYFRNINGIIEHTHYHLGQISLIKKMIRSKKIRDTASP